MRLIQEIPESFWSLFRSPNRSIYIEALLQINEEYQYNNYFLSKEVCVQIISNYVAIKQIEMKEEEQESEIEKLEPMATRILNWLIKTQWLKRLEDYASGITNIIIPDYASVFLEAFERLEQEDDNDTDVYIQSIYGILFSYINDGRSNDSMLKTAMINTRKLNKVLQNMLHNMDKFFASLLEKDSYGELLKEHLTGYVEEIVEKKYHILKTSDNFYQYKSHIQYWLNEISKQKIDQLEKLLFKTDTKEVEGRRKKLEEVLGYIESMQRGFEAIEYRITNMDKEHVKYVRATVTRLNYLLNEDSNMKGMVIRLLQHLSEEETEETVQQVSNCMRFTKLTVASSNLFYRRRVNKNRFNAELEQKEVAEELSKEDVLRFNKMKKRYSKGQIEDFIESFMEGGLAVITSQMIQKEEDFEKLILAYDLAIQRGSKFTVADKGNMIENEKYKFPELEFTLKQ